MPKHRKRNRRSLFQLRAKSQKEAPSQPSTKAVIMRVLGYGPDSIEDETLSGLDQLPRLDHKWQVLWLDISGAVDEHLVRSLGNIFGLHELALEDVMHRHQRPKVEPYERQLFMTLNGIHLEDGAVFIEQVSMFLGDRFVITFTDNSSALHLNNVRERIKAGAGTLRSAGADRLFYAIIDELVDGYFPVVESIGEDIEVVEDAIMERSSADSPARLHDLKRDVLRVRRAIWPARDALNVLIREDTSSLITAATRVYLRDCYDHAVRIMDFIETQREMCSDLMDLYLSMVSNRMNEIIKVLTVVTLLFMPPTLVAGIYGMNFMIPEYKWPMGYLWALTLMIASAAVVWAWALRSGWLDKPKVSK
jgi:magnesium transporter